MAKQTQYNDIHIDHNIAIPMRDGIILRADVYRPKGEGRWPVILMRFVGDPADETHHELGAYFSRRGYVFVYNNMRGAYQSEGAFLPLINDAWGEQQDGYDSVEWAARQPWSDGKVGLFGTSVDAFAQYTTAPTRPPSLKACMPFFGSNIHETVFPNGLYRLEEHRAWAIWMALNCLESEVAPAEREAVRARLLAARADPASWVWQLPVTDTPALAGVAPWHFEHLRHQTDLAWWAQTDARTKLAEIDVPILHVGGWYDLYTNGTLEHYTGLVNQGRSARCRATQRLVIGPWQHGHCNAPTIPPPLDFGDAARLDFKALALRWFDHWLKGIDNGLAADPPVRVFLMGENRWLDLKQWPPANLTYTPFYLRHGTGQNAASLNNGHLTLEAPSTAEQPDRYTYDPADPIIGHERSSLTPQPDQREREGRLLTYTSEPLREPVVVVGPVKAVLYAASSAPDTDWLVRLCDVWPDGRSVSICDGVVRARFRNSLEKEDLLEPGKVYCYTIEMAATAQTFLPGHRIRIHVTSSDFPRYDRNLNTGGPFGVETAGQVAHNSIFHDPERPSHVVLPVMREDVILC
ncbi:MAG: CocE/NonD family hydrolase [Caldilineaceae bacterium]